jgi:hypothetical protein
MRTTFNQNMNVQEFTAKTQNITKCKNINNSIAVISVTQLNNAYKLRSFPYLLPSLEMECLSPNNRITERRKIFFFVKTKTKYF